MIASSRKNKPMLFYIRTHLLNFGQIDRESKQKSMEVKISDQNSRLAILTQWGNEQHLEFSNFTWQTKMKNETHNFFVSPKILHNGRNFSKDFECLQAKYKSHPSAIRAEILGFKSRSSFSKSVAHNFATHFLTF